VTGPRLSPAGLDDGEALGQARATAETEEWDEAVVRRSARRHLLLVMGLRVLAVAGVLAAWQLASGRLVAEFWVSSPVLVVERLVEWLGDGTIWRNVQPTLLAMVTGFAAGALAGVCAGLALGSSRLLGEVAEPFLTALYSLPKVALAPLLILWLGIGISSKIFLAAVSVFFLVFYNTYSGVASIDRDLVNTARVMGAESRQLIQKVMLPSVAPWIFTGLRVSVPYALIGAVVAELIASSEGLGYLLRHSTGVFDTSGTFAALFVLAVISVIINRVVVRLDGLTTRWRSV
jgi:NitT/TauT family transport system permease protein